MAEGLGVRLAGNTFWHGGTHDGRARAWMCGNMASLDGIVVLTNSDHDATVADLRSEIAAAFRSASGWPASDSCGP
jgi:hypothetical protein